MEKEHYQKQTDVHALPESVMNAWNNNQDLYNVINHVMMTTMITLMDMYQQTQRTHKTTYNGNTNKNNYDLCLQLIFLSSNTVTIIYNF